MSVLRVAVVFVVAAAVATAELRGVDRLGIAEMRSVVGYQVCEYHTQVSTQTWCATGSPLVDCPPWPFCDINCFTDCTPGFAGAGTGSGTPGFGAFVVNTCKAFGSTYAIRKCGAFCFCNGEVINPTVTCPGNTYAWAVCDQ